jgi:hypothetical protein
VFWNGGRDGSGGKSLISETNFIGYQWSDIRLGGLSRDRFPIVDFGFDKRKLFLRSGELSILRIHFCFGYS